MKLMMPQALNDIPYMARGFDVERQARVALASSKFQSMTTDDLQPRSGVGQADAWRGVTQALGSGPGWIVHALAQLDQIDEEAAQEGYPSIGNEAKRRVRDLLFAMSRSSVAPAVYPSMDGEIAIYFKSPTATAALLILVDNKGGAGCYSSIHGESRRVRYDDSSQLPDEFVKAQLRTLGGPALSQSVE